MKNLIALICISFPLFGLSQVFELPKQINEGLYNTYAPSLSGDRKTMVYISDNTDDRNWQILYSESKPTWTKGVSLPKAIALSKMNYVYGHCLSFDGQTLYTTYRSGVFDYNINFTQNNNGNWSSLKAISNRINTSEFSEGSPSFTPDQRNIYFIRCKNLSATGNEECKIYHSEWNGKEWSEPEPMDLNVSGDITTPRILPDGKKMVFSANLPGGKGGYDFYFTEYVDEKWSKPIPMDEFNTPFDEVGAAFDMYGNRMFYPSKKSDKHPYKIVHSVLPAQYRSDNVVIMNYTVKRDITAGFVPLKIYDSNFNEVLNVQAYSSTGSVILEDDEEYLVYISPRNRSNRFIAESLYIPELSRVEILDVDLGLKPLGSGENMVLEGLDYLPAAPYITDPTKNIITSLAGFIRSNASTNIEIDVVMTNYEEDSIERDFLTEIRTDSVQVEILPDTPDSTSIYQAEIVRDTLASSTDSVMVRLTPIEPVYEWKYIYTYHNDRLSYEVLQLQNMLMTMNVTLSNVTIKGVKERPAEGKPERFLRVRVR